MSKERDALKKAISIVNCCYPYTCSEFIKEVKELLAQPEQVEHTKTKKEPAIYFAKDETGYIRPVFKNPKETHLWVDVLHGGGE